jgi:hypothetical protein
MKDLDHHLHSRAHLCSTLQFLFVPIPLKPSKFHSKKCVFNGHGPMKEWNTCLDVVLKPWPKNIFKFMRMFHLTTSHQIVVEYKIHLINNPLQKYGMTKHFTYIWGGSIISSLKLGIHFCRPSYLILTDITTIQPWWYIKTISNVVAYCSETSW